MRKMRFGGVTQVPGWAVPSEYLIYFAATLLLRS
jgi:hypothetical protein